MTTVGIYTLGCKVNQCESQKIADDFISLGYDVIDFDKVCDIYVINTCTVTSMADSKSRKMIRQSIKRNPEAVICVTGCYPVAQREEIEKIEGIDIILSNREKHKLASLCDDLYRKKAINKNTDSSVNFSTSSAKGLFRERASLKLQDGCRQFCTYCLIPYARGDWNSTAPEEAISEAKRLADLGAKEIVLLGIHLGCYGREWGKTDALSDIYLELLETLPDVRFRLGSVEPMEATTRLLNIMASHENACNHLHLPLQTGTDEILKIMNRPYNTSMYREKIQEARSIIQDIAITTDIMVGFPNETDELFEKTLEFADEMAFSKIHVFPYSQRPGTPADKMKNQVKKEDKDIRVEKLMNLSARSHTNYGKTFINKKLSVLFEEEIDKGIWHGHSKNYMDILVSDPNNNLKGQILDVTILNESKIHPGNWMALKGGQIHE